MRTLLVAGHGEREKTAVASATAWACAAAGHDTLLITTRPGAFQEHFQEEFNGEPSEVGKNLRVAQTDIFGELRKHWPAGWRYLHRLAAWNKVKPEEMLDSLGIEATSAFMQLGQMKGFDAAVVDCHLPPRDTARLVRGLGDFDEGMRRFYWPVRRYVMPPLRLGLMLGGLGKFPLPDEEVLHEVERAQVRARQAFQRLRSRECTARVVVPAGRCFPPGFDRVAGLRPDFAAAVGSPLSKEFREGMESVLPSVPWVHIPGLDSEGPAALAKRLYGGRDPLSPSKQ
ncbi:MAG: ArsA-related P-loop ATPase [Halobacteria archaeon]